MAEKRTRLADTVRKEKAAKKATPVAVADTFANKDVVLDRRTTIYLSQDNWKALKLRSVEEDKFIFLHPAQFEGFPGVL